MKRVVDIILSLVMLLALVPVFLLVAIGIKMDSPGPVIFKQKRIGMSRKPFMLIKFRTMKTDAPDPCVRYETLEDDPRITRFGRMVRENGVDELLQLINVIKGDMSIVGPRPLVEWESDQCVGEYADRFLFKPGITSLSVVEGRNSLDWDQRVKKDLDYVYNWSLLLDFKILILTPFVILFSKKGIYPTGKKGRL